MDERGAGSSRYGDPENSYFIPPGERTIGDEPQIGYEPWPAIPDYGPADLSQPSRELAILRHHIPHAKPALAQQIVDFVGRVRKLDLHKTPSISESVDWARTLTLLNADVLSVDFVRETLAALTKHKADHDTVSVAAETLLFDE